MSTDNEEISAIVADLRRLRREMTIQDARFYRDLYAKRGPTLVGGAVDERHRRQVLREIERDLEETQPEKE